MVADRSIEVTCMPDGDGWRCEVAVGDDAATTHHSVSVSRRDLDALDPGAGTPERLVVASFAFLLEREPRESILRRFDLSVIGSYFPEYVATIRRPSLG